MEIQLARPRILGLREMDCRPRRSEMNEARWRLGRSAAKDAAIRAAEKLVNQHGSRLGWRLEMLKNTPPADLWTALEMLWEKPQGWAVEVEV